MADGLLGPRSANGPRSRRDQLSSGHHSLGAASPRARSPRAMNPFSINMANKKEVERPPRKLILCFDGTGNKFHGDESDSNILKIFRMLDRSADDQYHYYQPGIGTYVVSDSLSHSGLRTRIRSWYQKAKDSAIGTSFDQHVVGGYRFLMRFYQRGDEMYMFGFSRGAYIARFLAEMLDYIGLLCHGNEEMVKFAWKAFAQWQRRKPASRDDDDVGEEDAGEDEETRRMYNYMKGFRETFSRPVGRIRFLGLFDTVNSVPQFETAWMQRSKFPYTARSSAQIIRHAVSIDERRAKFREDLMYQKAPKHQNHAHKHRHRMGEMMDRARASIDHTHAPDQADDAPVGKESHRQGFAPYRARSRCRQRMVRSALEDRDTDNMSCSDASQWNAKLEDSRDEDQDIDEVWFAGGHGDIGGGWEALDDRKSASHVPLAWMVREAIKAGLAFDVDDVTNMGCQDVSDNDIRRASRPDIQVQDEAGHVRDGLQDGLQDGRQDSQSSQSSPEMDGSEVKGKHRAQDTTPTSPFHEMMHRAHTSRIHDALEYGGGLGPMAVTAWKLMEYLPFRRMDLQPDGSWKPIRWPLPGGETRDIPDHVRVHGSVLRRMREDETYRPGNLIIGGGGRGVRRAKPEHGTGDWICVAEPGDVIGEIWSKKPRDANDTSGAGH